MEIHAKANTKIEKRKTEDKEREREREREREGQRGRDKEREIYSEVMLGVSENRDYGSA